MNSPWLRVLPPLLRRRIERRTYALRVINSMTWVLAQQVLRYATGFVLGIFIARHLGVEQYGLLAYASALVAVLAWLSSLGLDPVAVRELVQESGRRDDLLGSLVSLRACGALLLVLALIALLNIIDPADPRARTMAVLIAFAQLPMALESIDCWFYAQQAASRTAIAKIVALAILVMVRIVLIWQAAPVEAFAWAILAEGVVVATVMVIAYSRAGCNPRNLRPRLATLRTLLVTGWPLIAAAAAAAVYQRVDQVLIGKVAGFAAVGAYSVAMRFIEASYLVPVAMLLTLYPALVAARNSDIGLYHGRVQALFDAGFWSGLVFAFLLWLAGGTLVRLLFGREFDAAATVLSVLAWLPILTFTGLVRLRVLMAEGALRTALALELLVCALNIAGNLVLIPNWGAQGAATAALAAALLAPLIAAPFSPVVRRCNGFLFRALGAPLRLWQA